MRRSSSYNEMRLTARRWLPRGLFEYVDRGVGDETGVRALRESLDRVTVPPSVLRSDDARSIACTLFGTRQAAPFVIAPTAMAGLIHHDGELTLARAAAQAGFPICLSTQSVTSVGRLRRAVPQADIWMQLYLWQDRNLSLGLMKRARAADVRVLVMTVDTPYGARKEWNLRSGFDIPFRPSVRNIADICLHLPWALRTVLPGLIRDGWPRFENFPNALAPRLFGPQADPRVMLRRNLRWDDVAWVRDRWNGPMILKGIMTVQDARRAVSAGADGIIVSSHGARNLDAAPPPIAMLPQIAADVGDQITVLADSGVQRGLDVLRYRLKGAEAVMLGRLPLWALAAGGPAGVDAAIQVLRQEYVEALDFSGADAGAPVRSQPSCP